MFGAFCAGIVYLVVSALIRAFGVGWLMKLLPPIVVGPVIMLTKMMLLVGIIMWVRFSYPRFREDQLQTFAWKVLIPLSLANIAVTAILKVAV